MKSFDLKHLRTVVRHVLALRRKPLDPLWASSPTGARAPSHQGPPRVLPRSPIWVPAWAQPHAVARGGVATSSRPWAWIESERRTVPAVSPEFPALPGTTPPELLGWTDRADVLWLDVASLSASAGTMLAEFIDASADTLTRLGCRVEADPALPVCLWLAHYHGLRARGQQIKADELSLLVFDLLATSETPLGVALLGTDPALLEDISTVGGPGVLARPLGKWCDAQPVRTRTQTAPATHGPRDLRAACELLLGPKGDSASRLGRAVVLLMKHLSTNPAPPAAPAVVDQPDL